jgi:hypothetical protein
MLVYQYNADIIPRLRKIFKGVLDLLCVRLPVHDQKVPLPFRAWRYMLLSPVSMCNR